MANQYINKVIYGNRTLIDLTADTVEAAKILSGYTAHDKSGAPITGSCAFDVDSTDGTAAVAEILVGKTAYARGAKLTGTMPNNGSVTGTIDTVSGEYTIPMGFHDGSGKVSISSTEADKIVAGNIKSGVEILGVTGTYSGEAIAARIDISGRTAIYGSITGNQIIVELTHFGLYATGLVFGGSLNTDVSISYDPATGYITLTTDSTAFNSSVSCKANVYITEQTPSSGDEKMYR